MVLFSKYKATGATVYVWLLPIEMHGASTLNLDTGTSTVATALFV